jgi:hypothetical protein
MKILEKAWTYDPSKLTRITYYFPYLWSHSTTPRLRCWLVCISCCQNRHSQNIIYIFFRIARKVHRQTWRTLAIIQGVDRLLRRQYVECKKKITWSRSSYELGFCFNDDKQGIIRARRVNCMRSKAFCLKHFILQRLHAWRRYEILSLWVTNGM